MVWQGIIEDSILLLRVELRIQWQDLYLLWQVRRLHLCVIFVEVLVVIVQYLPFMSALLQFDLEPLLQILNLFLASQKN